MHACAEGDNKCTQTATSSPNYLIRMYVSCKCLVNVFFHPGAIHKATVGSFPAARVKHRSDCPVCSQLSWSSGAFITNGVCLACSAEVLQASCSWMLQTVWCLRTLQVALTLQLLLACALWWSLHSPTAWLILLLNYMPKPVNPYSSLLPPLPLLPSQKPGPKP